MMYVGWVILVTFLIFISLTASGISRKLDSLSDDLDRTRVEIRKILERIAGMRGEISSTLAVDTRITLDAHQIYHRSGAGCANHHCVSVISAMIRPDSFS